MRVPSRSSLLVAACVSFGHDALVGAANTIKIDNTEQNHTYEWEELNHYELLYLTSLSHQNDTAATLVESATFGPSNNSTSSLMLPVEERIRQRQAITTSDVKKGYKVAAKLHHPDKVMGKFRQSQREYALSGDGTLEDAPLSYEELNARMAMIVEAKEVLSDEVKRKRYDWYLLHYEENQERARKYASDISKPCKYDDECGVESGECCIKYHFKFCGDLSKYPAKALKCSGINPRWENPNERGVSSNREHRRPWQTVRHGYRSTLRSLGFVDAEKRSKVQSNNVLRDWMTVARDRTRWGALVEEKLGLKEGDFTSLYKN